MSCDYYFKKWLSALNNLKTHVGIDVYYHTSKVHDQLQCAAVQRIAGVLAGYCAVYNELVVCQKQNLQVQKKRYIDDIVQGTIDRILELKHQLQSLESSNIQFYGLSQVDFKLTAADTELIELPLGFERPDVFDDMLDEAFEYGKREKVEREKMEREQHDKALSNLIIEEFQWWTEDEPKLSLENTGPKFGDLYNVESKEASPETLKIRECLDLIAAHEKSRQVVKRNLLNAQKRELWRKELAGEAAPSAQYEIRDRAAMLIQRIIRKYFEVKRNRILEAKRDLLLDLYLCKVPSNDVQNSADDLRARNKILRKKYEADWNDTLDKLREKYKNKYGDQITEEYRDFVRHWFTLWFEQVKYFYDIPNDRNRGIEMIIKEEVPTPQEWVEEYVAYLAEMKANKNKSPMQLKYEKQQAKREANSASKEDKMKALKEKRLLQKLMTNPATHPGYKFSKSKKTDHLLQAIQKYDHDWSSLDKSDCKEVKQASVPYIDHENACCDVKHEVRKVADEDMRKELTTLRKSLKEYYKRIEENMPEMKKKAQRSGRKKRRLHKTVSAHVIDRLKDLAVNDVLKEYPKTKLGDFIGDQNHVGDDMRCDYRLAVIYNGNVRQVWWEVCRELKRGFRKVLLVGPDGSGRSMLVYALAHLNDAALFDLNPELIEENQQTKAYLDNLVKSVAMCAKAVQPSVIYLRNVDKLFYRKPQTLYKNVNWSLMKKYFVGKLFKRIHKNDRITIVGSCTEPWLTKSKQLLKKFPTAVMLPDTSYTTVIAILNDWVIRNNSVPCNLDVQSLARKLQGYTFGFIKDTLDAYLTADRIVKIASNHGMLPVQDIYDHFLDQNQFKVDYTKYQKWYTEKTMWGQKEAAKLKQQLEFKAGLLKLAEKREKEKRKMKIA